MANGTVIDWALKEWDAAVTALLQGQTVLLLRKGGIREQSGSFSITARQVLLLPTLEHQKADLLKPEFWPESIGSPGLEKPAPADGKISFRGWATITNLFSVPSEADLSPLLPHLVWNQRFLQERSRWQPERPIYGLLLRTYRLSSPVQLPTHGGYRGCRSWVSLGETVTVDTRDPTIAEAEYRAEVDRILALVEHGF